MSEKTQKIKVFKYQQEVSLRSSFDPMAGSLEHTISITGFIPAGSLVEAKSILSESVPSAKRVRFSHYSKVISKALRDNQ